MKGWSGSPAGSYCLYPGSAQATARSAFPIDADASPSPGAPVVDPSRHQQPGMKVWGSQADGYKPAKFHTMDMNSMSKQGTGA